MKRLFKPYHERVGATPATGQRLLKQNLLILGFCLMAVSGLSTSYALLSTTLDIGGQAQVLATEPIRISSVQPTEPPPSCGFATYPPTWSDTTFSVDGTLPDLDCVATFEITVKNQTADQVYIKQIIEDSFNNSANMDYVFSITPSTPSAVISAQGEMTFTLEIAYQNSLISLPLMTTFVGNFHLVFEKVAPPVLTVNGTARSFEIFRGDTTHTPDSLNGRVKALDGISGDLSDQIQTTCRSGALVVACPATWASLASGDYTLTYGITNSLGLSAAPVNFQVKLWDFAEIESGESHSFALSSHGLVWAWGYGATGRLGLGNTSNQTSPVFQSNLAGSADPRAPARRIVDIAANNSSSYALDDSGNLWAWGDKSGTALGNGSGTGNITTPTQIALPNGARAVEVDGYYRTGILRTDAGEVYTWGANSYGAAGTGNSTTVQTPTKLDNLPAVKKVAIGYYAGAAIDDSGNLWLWGSNGDGRLGAGFAGAGTTASGLRVTASNNLPNTYNGLTDVVDVKLAENHGAALLGNGDVYVWGSNYYGRLCNGSGNAYAPYKVPVSDVVQIAVHMNSTHMVTADGRAYSCGGNTYGEIQTGSTSPTNVTTPVANYQFNSGIVGITADTSTSHVLLDRLNVYGYGYSARGEVGNGATSNSPLGRAWNFTAPYSEW